MLIPKLARGGIYIIEDLHAQPPIESSLPKVPPTAIFLGNYFERESYIENPLLTPEDMAAIRANLASYAAFPAFDGSSRETKLIVLRAVK